MKGFPPRVDGPLGRWFKKVQAAVAAVSVGDSRERVVDLLGPPDEILHDAISAGGQLQGLIEGVAGGDTAIRYGDKEPFPETLVYADPYRPRKRYAFGMREGAVSTMWQETVAIGARQS